MRLNMIWNQIISNLALVYTCTGYMHWFVTNLDMYLHFFLFCKAYMSGNKYLFTIDYNINPCVQSIVNHKY